MRKKITKCICISISLTYLLFNWLFTFLQNSMSRETTFGGSVEGSATNGVKGVKGVSVSGGVSGSISNGIATKDDR